MTDDVTLISGIYSELGDAALPAGTIVDERYEIVRSIGQGGMCVVYEAKHLKLKRRCALKLLHLTSLASPESFQRFKREAVLASDLKHPNIIEIFGFDVWRKRPYIAMEYLEGQTLTQLVDEVGPLPEARAINILLQICDALQEAHAHHIVHRDLKPSNVIVLSDDKVKLVDFGIARLLPESGEEVQKLTQTGQVLGSFFYMSPEQCMGKAVTERTDFYAFGCLMYKLLTGKTPFDGDSPFAVMGQHLGVAPPAMANVSQSLQDVAMWCMRKDPMERPGTALDLREALTGNNQKITRPITKPAGPELKLSSAGKVAVLTVSMVLLVVLAGVGYLCWSQMSKPPVAAMDVEERRLLDDVAKAETAHDEHQTAVAADKLCQYYSARHHWKEAARAGYQAWQIANSSKQIPFSEQVWMIYHLACAQQRTGELEFAARTFHRLSDRWDDVPKDLKQLAAMHDGELCSTGQYLFRADRHFRKALDMGKVGEFGTLQQIRIEYADFLMRHPNVENMVGINPMFSRDEMTEDDRKRPKETPEHLLQQVIADGAPAEEDKKRIVLAEQMLNLIKQNKH